MAERDYAEFAAKVAVLEERMKTNQAEHRADIEKMVNIFTWRLVVVAGILGGLIVAAVRL
ncbi:MAG: hypothetical protein OXO52_22345 [Rhodospirillales bacterium]|nr:hypothetical protein [Rhodospirillales bacterium]MDE0381287.1 hypothetical protein [Rhodospirillales bacterium]